MTLLAWIVGTAAALYALHRLCLWMESKDWVYYRRKRKSGAAFLEIAAIVDPGARHVLEARKEIAAEEDDGDDDESRSPKDRVSAPARE